MMKLFKGAPVKGALVHGALLLVMLVYGYKVWTRDRSVESSTVGTVVGTPGADGGQLPPSGDGGEDMVGWVGCQGSVLRLDCGRFRTRFDA